MKLGFVVLFFAIVAYLIAPFTLGGRRLLVTPDLELDATQSTFLLSVGMDKLLTKPGSSYDTAILYPDRHQLRGTEPFIGYPLLGLPLRVVGLSDVDVFAVVRWLLILTSLVYAYLLFRALDVGPAVALAGAVLCWCQRGLLYGIERLQVVSIPLILPVIYHALMAWRSDPPRRRHLVGLFLFAALYPLCGMINATIAVMAGVLVSPLLVRGLAGRWVVPIVIAAAVDAVVLAPWLLDRADLKPYVSDAFLQIKHWNQTNLPAGPQDIPHYVDGLIGRGLTVAFVLLGALAVPRLARAPERYFGPLVAAALAIVAAVLVHAGGGALRTLGLLFQVVCWVTLALFWRDQARRIDRLPAIVTLGLGLFLCLLSFGPIYVSNPSPLASSLMRVLVEVLPPLKSIREFVRIWIFGAWFLSMYAAIRLGMALRDRGPALRVGAATLVALAALSSLYDRPLVATPDIEAPKDLVELASRSRRTGAIYVHPLMRWNSASGVSMIAAARELGRPIVNGYLGIEPPWFQYATRVLRRYPDPEALWLLRTWNVETVVDVTDHVVWEVDAGDLHHPSRAPMESGFSTAEPSSAGSGPSRAYTIPDGFNVSAVEIHFGLSVVQRIPTAIDVYAFDGARGARLNDGRSGEWIEALAADALVHRQSPVATIKVVEPPGKELQLNFRGSDDPSIERVVLIGHSR